jgi:hypothetical protein
MLADVAQMWVHPDGHTVALELKDGSRYLFRRR